MESWDWSVRRGPDCTSWGDAAVINRRGVLKLSLGLAAVHALDVREHRGGGMGGPSAHGLMDAFEEYGQWASSHCWARDIHQSMGAKFLRFVSHTARGLDAACVATKRALQGVNLLTSPPTGAVVIVCGANGAQNLRDAYAAYRVVRDQLPLDSYCAYSPLLADMPPGEATVNVAFGWQ